MDILIKNIALSLILTMAFFATGCEDNKKNLQKQPADKPKAAAAQPSPQNEEPKIEKEVYIYEAKDRRDPFISLIAIAKEKPQKVKRANPVENYDVDEIKVSAIVSDSRYHYALITLPDGKSYTVKKGMTLGLYGGRVSDITKDSLIITENVKDYRGQPRIKDTILKLRKEGEE